MLAFVCGVAPQARVGSWHGAPPPLGGAVTRRRVTLPAAPGRRRALGGGSGSGGGGDGGGGVHGGGGCGGGGGSHGLRCQHTASDAVPRKGEDAPPGEAVPKEPWRAPVAATFADGAPTADGGRQDDDEAPEYYEDTIVDTDGEEEEAEMILQRQAKVARERALLAVAKRKSARSSELPIGVDDGLPSSSIRALAAEEELEAEQRALDVRSEGVPLGKKAPITLIRCDGYICEREAVDDGNITFRGAATEQVMMVWNSRPRRVLILTKKGPDLLESLVEAARHMVNERGMAVMVEPAVHAAVADDAGVPLETFSSPSTLHQEVDLVVCLGGDGLILHVSTLFRGPVPPVLSFNLGSLGFLTPFDFKDFGSNMAAVVRGQCLLSLRMRLTCSVLRAGVVVKEFDVLNEVVVDRGASPYLSNLDCFCDGKLITTVQADGIIMSTPTGSTAYSMSAGGSMVHPSVPAILFTPICPHSLSFRPIVFPDAAKLRIDVAADSRSTAWASFDGKYRQQLRRGDGLMVQMSMFPVPTVNAEDDTSDWFASLDRAFNFNSRAKQKGL